MAQKLPPLQKLCKVDVKQGLVFGFAIVCKIRDETPGEMVDYYDEGSLDEHDGVVYSDHISEEEMVVAASDFMKSARVHTDDHAREADGDTPVPSGQVLHSIPLTTDLLKSLGMTSPMTGWLVAVKPDPPTLEKWVSGELQQFSIGGAASRQKVA